MVVLAHAGHWLGQLAYLVPLLLLVGVLLHGRWQQRKKRRDATGESERG